MIFLLPRIIIIFFSVIDLSDNRIDDENILEEIFVKLPNLAVLYLHGNPCIKKISNYRKKFIYTLKNLKFLVKINN